MVQLLELENGNIIMFNDENIKEEEVIETFEMGDYSSHFIVLTKRQYENVFKSKNSIIKEIPKNALSDDIKELLDIKCVNVNKCASCYSTLCSEKCPSYLKQNSTLDDLNPYKLDCYYLAIIDNKDRDKVLYQGEMDPLLFTLSDTDKRLFNKVIVESKRITIPALNIDKLVVYLDDKRSVI